MIRDWKQKQTEELRAETEKDDCGNWSRMASLLR